MFPITPEMVKEAYEKTGLKPTTGYWFKDRGEPCACGLGAVVADRFGIDVIRVPRTGAAIGMQLGLSAEQVYHFAAGFDGDTEAEQDEPYLTGRKAAQLVGLIPADPTTPSTE